jgi:hypothetical protein
LVKFALAAVTTALLMVPACIAEAAPLSLPTVKRTLSAAGTSKASCFSGVRAGKGVASTTYRAPMSGFVDIRSAGSGDWDLAIYDSNRRTRAIQASNGFGSREVVQTWTTAGQLLVVQACHRSGSGSSLPVAITFSALTRPTLDRAPQLLRIAVNGNKGLARLETTGVDVTHEERVGSVDAVVTGAKQLSAVKDAGFKFRVLDDNMFRSEAREAAKTAQYAAAAEPSPLPTGRKDYRQLEDYEAELKQITEKFRGIAKPVELPKRSFQGRPLMGVELSDNVDAKDDGKPTYFVMGTHHAREWPAGEIAMEFAWHVVNNYGTDAQITSLL